MILISCFFLFAAYLRHCYLFDACTRVLHLSEYCCRYVVNSKIRRWVTAKLTMIGKHIRQVIFAIWIKLLGKLTFNWIYLPSLFLNTSKQVIVCYMSDTSLLNIFIAVSMLKQIWVYEQMKIIQDGMKMLQCTVLV